MRANSFRKIHREEKIDHRRLATSFAPYPSPPNSPRHFTSSRESANSRFSRKWEIRGRTWPRTATTRHHPRVYTHARARAHEGWFPVCGNSPRLSWPRELVPNPRRELQELCRAELSEAKRERAALRRLFSASSLRASRAAPLRDVEVIRRGDPEDCQWLRRVDES